MWQAGKLAPVSFYHRFLMGLKERPNEQIIVANITSPGLLTPSGYRLNFSDNPPVVEQCEKNEEYLTSNLDMCCPNGQCGAIPDPVSCPDKMKLVLVYLPAVYMLLWKVYQVVPADR